VDNSGTGESLEAPEVVADRYEILGELGRGRYGEVYRAHDRRLGNDVALKVLKGSPDTTTLFRESQFLKSLESPYIIRVENADSFHDLAYIATAIAPGGSLEDHLPAYGMPPDRVLVFARQALIGIRACHEYGLVHQDIKPANIFLNAHDQAAIGDFGTAQKLIDCQKPAGDPLVRAPEMLKGVPGSVVTDVYSTGVTLYRLLSGRWPVDWLADFQELKSRVIIAKYPPLGDIAPHVPPALTRVVRKAMELDAAARYQSAQEMSVALSRVDLGRRWARQASHQGHAQCWVDSPAGVSAREVCVVGGTATAQIVVRRTTGTKSRLLPLCRSSVPVRRLPVELRAIFAEP
jgi:serine/threonine protein kinase